MKSIFYTLLFSILSLFSCQSQDSSSCPFPHQDLEKGDICGLLEVPRDRENPERGNINIAYVVIKAKTPNTKEDPIIYIQGGPGGSVIPYLNIYKQASLDPNRDFILFDQRGTGYSDAICTELTADLLGMLAKDQSIDAEFRMLSQEFDECISEVQKNGGKLSDYNTLESVADMEDLRKHLGYESWNLFGGSYGTRLGLIYMRLFPEVVRSTVMVGLFPLEIHMFDSNLTNFDRSLQKVFEACEDDPSCQQKYPDLKQTFLATIEELQQNPLTYSWNNDDFVLNSQDMLLFIHQMLYSPVTYRDVPSYILAVKNKETEKVAAFTSQQTQRMGFVNIGVFWAVMYGDEGTYDNAAKVQAELDKFPQYDEGISFFASGVRLLKEWGATSENFAHLTATKSDIPTLLISGEFDPITPPSNADSASMHLSQAYVVEFKGEGHAPFGPCFSNITRSFLDAPEKNPDIDCASQTQAILWR